MTTSQISQDSRFGILVTGASRGLGRALAEHYAALGHPVALVARGAADLAGVVARIRERGGRAYAIEADVARKEDVHRIAQTAEAMCGPVGVLFHNASTLGPVPMPLLLDTECEALEHVLQTNVVGPFRLTKIVAGAMSARGGGTIVHVSSDAAVEAYAHWGAYGASKSAHDHLQRVLAAEIASVRFISIDPGEMDTKMHADAFPDADRQSLARPDDVARSIAAAVAAEVASGARIEASSFAVRSAS